MVTDFNSGNESKISPVPKGRQQFARLSVNSKNRLTATHRGARLRHTLRDVVPHPKALRHDFPQSAR
jgi:hypothetical protein